jgi:vitamin B12 transporter
VRFISLHFLPQSHCFFRKVGRQNEETKPGDLPKIILSGLSRRMVIGERSPIYYVRNTTETNQLFMYFSFKNTLIAGFSLLAFSAFSQTEQLDEVTVTANKFPQKFSQVGKIITVINDSTLRSNETSTLTDLLNRQTGVVINGANQTAGSVQTPYLRGASAGLTLILVDGVPVYDASTIDQNFDLNFMPLQQIERIEILRGGQSTLYGSAAVAGVIHIITKKNTSQKINSYASLSGGSFGTLKGTAGINGTQKSTNYQLNFSSQKSKGFSSADVLNGEKDGFLQNSLQAAISQGFGKYFVTNANVKISSYRTDLDAGPFTDDTDFTSKNKNLQLGIGTNYQKNKTEVRLSYQRNLAKRSFLDDSTSIPKNAFNYYSFATYDSYSDFAEFNFLQKISKNFNLLLGVDFSQNATNQTYESVSSYGFYASPSLAKKDTKMNNVSSFISGVYVKNKFTLEAGTRFNNHSIYGKNWSYSFNPSYRIGAIKMLGVLANSFKNPSLYQLYSEYGNKTLKPEKAFTVDAGIQVFNATNRPLFRAVYFYRNLSNLFFFETLNDFPYGKYVNLNTQQNTGLELEAEHKWKKIEVNFNQTYLLKTYTTDEKTGTKTAMNEVLRRPKNTTNLSVSYQISSKMMLNTSIHRQSKRQDRFYNAETFQSELVDLKQFTLLNIHLNYKISKQIQLFAEGKNLFNQSYQEIYGYQSSPINFQLGIAVKP